MKMIVIGGSSGGLDPLKVILRDLSLPFDAAVLVVRHSTPGGPSFLTPILAQHTALPVVEVEHLMPVQAGTVYVSPPGVTVTLQQSDNQLYLFLLDAELPQPGEARPNINRSLRSAATLFGENCIGVVLSGYLNDGTQGAIKVDQVNGTMIVQAPSDAEQSSMPWSVITGDSPDFILPDVQIGSLISSLVSGDIRNTRNLLAESPVV